ncbi:hypothetical protein LZ31DRAFT_122891 [Colletotrichum somersetense]|nr:hypothetical protein LZ31DRAFT_122891 [Colletotrichum somersetense]
MVPCPHSASRALAGITAMLFLGMLTGSRGASRSDELWAYECLCVPGEGCDLTRANGGPRQMRCLEQVGSMPRRAVVMGCCHGLLSWACLWLNFNQAWRWG